MAFFDYTFVVREDTWVGVECPECGSWYDVNIEEWATDDAVVTTCPECERQFVAEESIKCLMT